MALIELDDDLAETIEELQRAGVDVTADVPSNIRAQVGRQSSEEAKLTSIRKLKRRWSNTFLQTNKTWYGYYYTRVQRTRWTNRYKRCFI